MHAVTDWASAAVDWRLFLPESWDERKATDEQDVAEIVRKRARCAIPTISGTGRSGGWRWT